MEEVRAKLLNFAEPLDIPLLDRVVNSLFQTGPEFQQAQKILMELEEHPDAWLRVDSVLEHSTNPQTKYFALNILEKLIKYRWKVLPRDQAENIKNYLVNLIIKMSSDEGTYTREKQQIGKMNMTLVQILKQEWPHSWQSFIPDIVGASRTNETLCENNMNILKLLSEEVFDFSSGQLTAAKAKELKQAYNSQFQLIYELCEYIMSNSKKSSLITATLQCLLRFLNWIPLGYIFETDLIDRLVQFYVVPSTRSDSLRCLTEIGSLHVGGPQYDSQFIKIFYLVMQHLVTIIPKEQDLADAHLNSSDDDATFLELLALFFTGYLKLHRGILEVPAHAEMLIDSLHYLVNLSTIEEVEVFKICLEFWHVLANDLFVSLNKPPPQTLVLSPQPSNGRAELYAPVLTRVRLVMISRMAKPEEVIVVENDDGEVVKETLKDTDSIVLYKQMRETLVFLTHLDYEDTESIMLSKLTRQMNGSEWSWNGLNTLCWAIGSISGAMSEEAEKRFVVTVIKDLLHLCEMKRGKDNKAIIASNIMYVVGQYPRFLRAHWKFLKTVVNKLFEFMHEVHPGVQDMACETFLKISQKCRRKFVVVQLMEATPFIDDLLTGLHNIICDLQPHQIQMFYEAVGYMISSQSDIAIRDNLVGRLMALPNQNWVEYTQAAQQDVNVLKQNDVIKQIINIIKTNVKAATSLQHAFIPQLQRLYSTNLLDMYKAFSEMVGSVIATAQPGSSVTQTHIVKVMRGVKREILRLLEVCFEKADNPQLVATMFIPPLLDPVLGDYARSVADARDPEVLTLFAVIINKLGPAIQDAVPRIMEMVFDSTLGMITTNFEAYPDHRINFFTLLRAINNHCFDAFFSLPPERFKLVIDSIVWAFKHTESKIANTGLSTLLELLNNVQRSQESGVANTFHSSYLLSLVSDVFYVLTDTFHKPGFKLHSAILMHFFQLLQSNSLTAPLNPAQPDNQTFVRMHVTEILTKAFVNMTPESVANFVAGLFSLANDEVRFKTHLRDFLVQSKEFASANNQELFVDREQQEAAEQERLLSVPGLVAPHERPDYSDMAD